MTIVVLGFRYEEDGSRFLQDKLPRGHGSGSSQARDGRNHEARQASGKARPSELRDGRDLQFPRRQGHRRRGRRFTRGFP